MNLHWYGWAGLIISGIDAINSLRVVVVRAWRQQDPGWAIVELAFDVTIVVMLLVGAS